MNKHDFINTMLVRHMSKAPIEQAKQKEEEYEKHIPSHLDFDYLYDMVIQEYTSSTIPPIKWLKEYFKVHEDFKQMFEKNYTWDIYAKEPKTNFVYSFGNWFEKDKSDYEQVNVAYREFRKNRPNLIIVGNNISEISKRVKNNE